MHRSKPGLQVKAFTGSGKTGCFAVAALQSVNPSVEGTQVIILSPTKLLTEQTFNVVSGLAKGMGVTVEMLHGDVQLKTPTSAQVVVGTAGKLAKATTAQRGKTLVNPKSVHMLVLDECDDLMQGSSFVEVHKVRQKCPKAQVLLFGASFASLEADPVTSEKNIKTIFGSNTALKVSLGDPAWDALRQDVLFCACGRCSSVGNAQAACKRRSEPASRVERLGMFYYPDQGAMASAMPTIADKAKFVGSMLEQLPGHRALVFVESHKEAHEVACLLAPPDAPAKAELDKTFNTEGRRQSSGDAAASVSAQAALAQKLKVGVIHGRMDLSVQQLVLKRLVDDELHVLVGTNSLSSGMDVPNVDVVFNLGFPMTKGSGQAMPQPEIKVFQNRVGRTARDGHFGACVIVLGTEPHEARTFESLSQYLHFQPVLLDGDTKRQGKMLKRYVAGKLTFSVMDTQGKELELRKGPQPRPPRDEEWIARELARRGGGAAAAGSGSSMPSVGAVAQEAVGV